MRPVSTRLPSNYLILLESQSLMRAVSNGKAYNIWDNILLATGIGITRKSLNQGDFSWYYQYTFSQFIVQHLDVADRAY
ncbi:hypothetical protein L6164_024117 [Bauhinia variegata]|uniref:Uncharacterized protein n=1 Tax=Bauhinia variegata TaxID=167791 RepID=A0ACB9LWT2_BAUVA|nr:hypothetical protein L6164_024117 [Bauhinia variegata]